jgi:signal transduction histidine kinase
MDVLLSLGVLLLVTVTVVNLLLAFVVYRSGHGKLTNKLFGLLSISLSLCLVAVRLSIEEGRSVEFSLTWIRLSVFFAVPIVLLFSFLVRSIPDNDLGLSRRTILVHVVGSLVVMSLTLSPLVFFEAVPTSGIPRPIPGPAIVVFAGYVLGGTGAIIYTVIKKIRSLQGQERSQLLYISFGALFMLFLVFATIIVPVAIFQNGVFVPLFPAYTLVFTGAASYAILRHNLFDLKVVATEVITLILWVVLFSKIFTAQNLAGAIVDGVVFIIIAVFGVLLVRSVRKEVEQRRQLEVLNKRLEELDEQKDEFLNIASHELRAPMTAVKGYISMVQSGDGGEVPVEAGKLLAEAAAESDRMLRLINNMLNVARIEEGRMVYETGEVKLAEVVERVFNEFTFDAQNKALNYTYEPAANISDLVEVDVDRIHEVVANLINNAIKYTDEGSVVARITNPATALVRVEVEDTGPGMTAEEVGKLFQKFYRAESYVGKKMGSGLGLYISRLLVEKFGGKIGVKSQKGKGSIFWFELPTRW